MYTIIYTFTIGEWGYHLTRYRSSNAHHYALVAVGGLTKITSCRIYFDTQLEAVERLEKLIKHLPPF